MQDVWKNKDLQKAADSAHVDKSQLFFPLSSLGIHTLLKTVHSPTKRSKLTTMSRILSDERAMQNYENTAYNLIYEPTKNPTLLQTLDWLV
jgi:hypothetical protein